MDKKKEPVTHTRTTPLPAPSPHPTKNNAPTPATPSSLSSCCAQSYSSAHALCLLGRTQRADTANRYYAHKYHSTTPKKQHAQKKKHLACFVSRNHGMAKYFTSIDSKEGLSIDHIAQGAQKKIHCRDAARHMHLQLTGANNGCTLLRTCRNS